MGDETEVCDFGKTPGERTPVVRDVVEGVREAAQVLVGQRAARSGNALAGAFLGNFLKPGGTGEELVGFFMKWINPVFFRGFLVGVEFALMACEAFAKSQCHPVAGFVNGTFVKLRIAETLGEKGAVSVFFLEMSGKFAQGEAHTTGGEVGFAPGFHDEEPPQLGDEGKSASPGERIPAYPFVAVFEAQGRPRRPTRQEICCDAESDAFTDD